MGKTERQSVRLVLRCPPDSVARSDRLVLCPFMEGEDPATTFWLGALAWHDVNARLLAALDGAAAPRCTVYAGVFCVDLFRRDKDIFAALQAAGIQGVINLPSVSFMDGELATILASFDLGVEREIAFLRRARAAGFRIAGCAADPNAVEAMVQAGAELIVTHARPPLPGKADAGRTAAARLRQRFGNVPPVISAGELLATLGT
jgi:predicted TIM-barrel enzyme